jgi:hypothetical protein
MSNEMIEWPIHSHHGVGVLEFGAKKSEVTAALREPTSAFRKAPFSDTDTLEYRELGAHLYFDPADRLESVEAFRPMTIQFEGLQLLGVQIDQIVSTLKQRGFAHRDLIFDEAGFSLFVEDGIVTGVNVFPTGYHDLNDPNSAASRVQRLADAYYAEQFGDEAP